MVRVAGVGLGGLGRLECHTLSAIDGVDLVGGVDVDPEARETFDYESADRGETVRVER